MTQTFKVTLVGFKPCVSISPTPHWCSNPLSHRLPIAMNWDSFLASPVSFFLELPCFLTFFLSFCLSFSSCASLLSWYEVTQLSLFQPFCPSYLLLLHNWLAMNWCSFLSSFLSSCLPFLYFTTEVLWSGTALLLCFHLSFLYLTTGSLCIGKFTLWLFFLLVIYC